MPDLPLRESENVTVCQNCNVVLGRNGERVTDRPATACSHLNTRTYVAVPSEGTRNPSEEAGRAIACPEHGVSDGSATPTPASP